MKEKLTILPLIYAIVVIIFFLVNITTSLPTKKSDKEKQYCETSACKEAADFILGNMNKSVDPCDDFYRFACGNFIEKTVLPEDSDTENVFDNARDLVLHQLKMELTKNETNENEPETFEKLRQFYKMCTEDEGKKSTDLEYLAILSNLGGWPVLAGDNWNESKFAWNDTVLRLGKEGFANNLFVDLDITVDNNDKKMRRIKIDSPSLAFSPKVLSLGLNQKKVKSYYAFLVNVAELFGANRSQATKELRESVLFEIKLANISIKTEEEQALAYYHKLMSVRELQSEYPYVDWLDFLNKYLSPHAAVEENEEVIVLAPNYLRNLGNLLDRTSKRAQANYAFSWLTRLYSFILSKNVRNLKTSAPGSISTTVKQVSLKQDTCLNTVLTSFSMAMSSLYVRKYVSNSTKENVNKMLSNIRKAFISLIDESDWMGNKTKALALEKLEGMTAAIAYPDEFFDDNKIDSYYNDLDVVTGNLFKTYRNLKNFNTGYKYKSLENAVKKFDWVDESLHTIKISAYYVTKENRIIIPSGVMLGFLYHNDHPEYLTYAVLGSTLGHEMTHGFDTDGRYYDKDGNIAFWWDKKSIREYNKKVRCIEDQYNNYSIKEIDMNLDGSSTKAENIADNGGLKEAYRAYMMWLESNKQREELYLRSLEDYTPKQMFWIAYANMRCSKNTLDYLSDQILTDEHAPDEFRVIGSISNLAEFSNDFKCPPNSKMNPANKCSVWR